MAEKLTRRVTKMLGKRGHLNTDLKIDICDQGRVDLFRLALDKGDRDWGLSEFLFAACLGGNQEMVNLVIQHGGNDWNLGLEGACAGGQREIAEQMIRLGATNFDNGLRAACEEGHLQTAEWMIQLGGANFGNAFLQAFDRDQLEIVKFLLPRVNQEELNLVMFMCLCDAEKKTSKYLLGVKESRK